MRDYERNVYPGEKNGKELSALLLSKGRDQKEIQTGKRKKKKRPTGILAHSTEHSMLRLKRS